MDSSYDRYAVRRMMVYIAGYEGKYSITDDGRVFSHISNKFIKPHNTGKGYLQVDLCVEQKHTYAFVHRLVAAAFISNPDNLPVVNHKDENRSNNNVSNLEWCTYQYNSNYSNVGYRANLSRQKKVKQFDLNGEFIREFSSVAEIEKEFGYSHSNIINCCNKPDRYKTSYGFVWRYSD